MAGYEGILGKAKLLLTANIHDLLDRALNANKPAVFDEQINQLQGSLEKITVCLGESIGRERTLTREIAESKEDLAKIDGEIDRLLEVEEKERQRSTRPSRARQLSVELFVVAATVANPCEPVGDGSKLCFGEAAGV